MINPKQKAFLRSMGQKEKAMINVGKNGIIPELIISIDELLRTRELVKINILETAHINPKEAAEIIAGRTRSTIIQVIGRKVVLYKKNPHKPTIELPKA